MYYESRIYEMRTKSSQYGLYELGDTHVTIVRYNEKQVCEYEQIFKFNFSPNCSLKLENMKLELLVIVNQEVTVNCV